MLRSKVYDFSPTMGILRIDSGARNAFSVPRATCHSPQGLASLVAIFETVLLVDRPKEMGSPVSRMIRWRSRSEEHTSELQSLMRISYAVFCLKNKKTKSIKQK